MRPELCEIGVLSNESGVNTILPNLRVELHMPNFIEIRLAFTDMKQVYGRTHYQYLDTECLFHDVCANTA
jgi:hypothetical protein